MGRDCMKSNRAYVDELQASSDWHKFKSTVQIDIITLLKITIKKMSISSEAIDCVSSKKPMNNRETDREVNRILNHLERNFGINKGRFFRNGMNCD